MDKYDKQIIKSVKVLVWYCNVCLSNIMYEQCLTKHILDPTRMVLSPFKTRDLTSTEIFVLGPNSDANRQNV